MVTFARRVLTICWERQGRGEGGRLVDTVYHAPKQMLGAWDVGRTAVRRARARRLLGTAERREEHTHTSEAAHIMAKMSAATSGFDRLDQEGLSLSVCACVCEERHLYAVIAVGARRLR